MKTKDLIAYNSLKEGIIDTGFCTLCGACEAACPIHALRIEHDEVNRVCDCAEHVNFCPICYDVCPHTETLLLESTGFVADAPNRRESLGFYRKVLMAQASDSKLRELSNGGGVVSALLANGIRSNLIDSAVVSTPKRNGTFKLQSSVSLVPDDISAAVDMGYSPSAVGTAFGKAVNEYGKNKIAFVGTPCQVTAVRKLESFEHKIMDSLRVVIGLTCLWSFSLNHLLRDLERTRGVKSSEIKRISLHKKYLIHTEDRLAMISVKEAKKHILKGCLTCLDFTAELADISVGGAYPLDDWSVVIIRTKRGEEIFDDAVEKGAISVQSLEAEPEVFAHLAEMANFKLKTDLESIDRIKATGGLIPPSATRLLQALPKELSLLSSLSVEETMTNEVLTVAPDTTMAELLNFMTKHHHMGYPIVDEGGDLLGIATFEDVMKTDPDERTKTNVGTVKQKKLFTVFPKDTALKAYEKMVQNKVGRVLVVDPKNPKKVAGIITKTDIMQILRWPMKTK